MLKRNKDRKKKNPMTIEQLDLLWNDCMIGKYKKSIEKGKEKYPSLDANVKGQRQLRSAKFEEVLKASRELRAVASRADNGKKKNKSTN
jgi:hypothetical protein